MNNFRHHSQGLILIEVAIAMIIFSVCIGGILILMQHSYVDHQHTLTQTHKTLIIKALNRYHRQEGHLPCPSLPDSEDGIALERCQGPSQQIGILPYKTLGLSAEIARDGHGHFFTYAVSEQSTLSMSNRTPHSSENTLVIMDRFGHIYGSRTNEPAFVLISHGSKGDGAFTLQSDRNRFPTHSMFDAENASDTLTFYADVPTHQSNNKVFFVHQADLESPPLTTPSSSAPHPSAIDAVQEDDPYAEH
jgi:hypothetical protein